MTVTDRAAVPPAPLQVRLKVVVVVSEPLLLEPELALVPVQPPEAVQALASVLDQASVVLPPLAIDAGVALKLSVGAGVTGAALSFIASASFQPGLLPAPL